MTTFPRRLGVRAFARAPLLLKALAALTLAIAPLGSAWADRDDEGDEGREPHAIGLWGDLPYSAVQIATGVPDLIADMNAHGLKFTVHDGDLKQGSGSLCDDNLYYQSQAFFNQLRAPAMFTPGDNDWTDCDRPSNGGFSSRERLDRERQIFFSTTYSMGQRPMRQQVQTEALCLGVNGLVPCVENRRWTVGGVTYVTLNVPGSCNNLCDTAPDPAEFAARNAANIKWMKESFAVASARRSAAVMIIAQANPGWDASDATRAPVRDPATLAEVVAATDGYKDYLLALRDQVTTFRKPVAYVHGDSHYFRVDKPFLSATGQRLENFTRVETFGNNAANGNNDVHWIKVT
ncbi:MAG: hypothetical protein V4739_15385, partial [Pseudomonadota bacterium]